VRFFSATFGAGVNAPHCPITRPKRRKQPERYVPLCLKDIAINILYKNNEQNHSVVKKLFCSPFLLRRALHGAGNL
jgi:hypothetical protein